MKDFKRVARTIGFHTKIMLKGFVKVLYGAAMSGLIALAVVGFSLIPTEGGYAAVCDFICSVCFTVIALCGMYYFGCSKNGGRSSAKW